MSMHSSIKRTGNILTRDPAPAPLQRNVQFAIDDYKGVLIWDSLVRSICDAMIRCSEGRLRLATNTPARREGVLGVAKLALQHEVSDSKDKVGVPAHSSMTLRRRDEMTLRD